MMRVAAVVALGLCGLLNAVMAKEALEPWGDLERDYLKLEREFGRDLKKFEPSAQVLDRSQALVIAAGADLRSPSNCGPLVQLLPARYVPVPGPAGSVRARHRLLPGDLDHHPAAWSLKAIGVPAVEELCSEIDRLGGGITNERLVLVGGSVRSILNWHTRHYLEWRRRGVVPQLQGVYDRLIALDIIRNSGPRGAAGSPDRESLPPTPSSKVEPRRRYDARFVSNAFVGEAREEETQDTIDVAIGDWRRRVDASVLDVVRGIPRNSLTLTSQQIAAIDAAGRYQVRAAVPKLMTLCTVRIDGRTGGREPGALSFLPAARALARMGWTTSFAIREELQSRDAVILPERFLVFAMILREIWAGYAEEFVRVERLESPSSVDGSRYESLIAAIRSIK